MNKYLIFRTDKIGNFLISAILIKSIRRNDPDSFINVVASEKNYNYIILMNINRKIQRQRVMKRKNMTMQLFKKILSNQISYKKKKNVDFVVNNNGSKEKTRQILKKVLNKIISTEL